MATTSIIGRIDGTVAYTDDTTATFFAKIESYDTKSLVSSLSADGKSTCSDADGFGGGQTVQDLITSVPFVNSLTWSSAPASGKTVRDVSCHLALSVTDEFGNAKPFVATYYRGQHATVVSDPSLTVDSSALVKFVDMLGELTVARPSVNEGSLEAALAKLSARYSEITALYADSYNFYDDYNELAFPPGLRDINVVGDFIGVFGSYVLAGGIQGAEVEDTPVSRLMKFDLSGVPVAGWNSALFAGDDYGFIRQAIVRPDGKIYVGGHFTEVNGNSDYQHVALLNADGTLDESFVPSAPVDRVLCMYLLPGGDLLLGTTNKLYRVAEDGTLDNDFRNNANDALGAGAPKIHALAYDDDIGKILVGGQHTSKMNRLNMDGTADVSFSAAFTNCSRVSSIFVTSNYKYLVAQWGQEYNSAPSASVVRLLSDGTLDTSFVFSESLDDNPQVVRVSPDGNVYVGGWFSKGLIRCDVDGLVDSDFPLGTGFDNRVQDLDFDASNNVYAAGEFQRYNGGPLRRNFSYRYEYNRGAIAFAKLSNSGVLLGNQADIPLDTIGIGDGSNDMYDGGNYLNTNRTNSYVSILGNDHDFARSIVNTHTPAVNDSDDVQYNSPPMDGQVKEGTVYFGAGSTYFTNMYPGLFVMMADNVDITEFSIGGNLGSDGYGIDAAIIYPINVNGSEYTVAFKTNYDAGDPSVNHIIIVPGSADGLTQLYDDSSQDDNHCLQGLVGRSKVYFLLLAGTNGAIMTQETATQIATQFLTIIA